MLKNLTLLSLILCFAVTVFSQLPDGRNHPELKWQELETTHFRILYHQGLEQLAGEAAIIAENAYTRITTDLHTEIPSRTTLILSDVDDITNGIANPLDHTIFIWTYGANKLATGTIPWLKRVISHEFGHVATFWAGRTRLGKWGELLTLSTSPTWFLEGVAQYEAESWDAHRNALLRSAFNCNALISAPRMDGFIGTNQIESRLVYEQGHALMRYIEKKYGSDAAARLIATHRKFPLSFSRTMKKVLGKSMDEIYNDWETTLSEAYLDLDLSGHHLEVLTTSFQGVMGVRYHPGGKTALVGVETFDENVQRLYIQNKKTGRFQSIGGTHVSAFFTWTKKGDALIYSRLHRGSHGSLIHDLYSADCETGQEIRLTHDERATDPAANPIDGTICYVRHQPQGSELCLLNLDTGQSQSLFNLENGSEVFCPSWSCDGKWIAFSFIDNIGQRDLATIQSDGSGFTKLTDSTSDDRTPAWHPGDPNRLVFCSTADGSPALYLMDTQTKKIQHLTTTNGGYFNPTWQTDGQSVTAILMNRTDSVQAVRLPARPDGKNEHTPYPAWTTRPVQTKENNDTQIDWTSGNSIPYRSFKRAKPLLTIPFFGEDNEGCQIGIAHYAADPLYKHQFMGYVLKGHQIDTWLQYTNAQWTPIINLDVYARSENRGTIINLLPSVWQRRIGLSFSLTVPANWGKTLLSNHAFSIQGVFDKLEPIDSDKYLVLKPQFQPFEGRIHEMTLTYSWVWQRPDVASGIHPANGLGFSCSVSRADKRIGSDWERTRVAASFKARKRIWKQHALAGNVREVYQWGCQPFQERQSIQSPYGIRALPAEAHGHRFLLGAAEYRIPLIRDLQFTLPFIYFERMAMALWCDGGKAWGADLDYYSTNKLLSFSDAPWLMTTGLEWRVRFYLVGKLPVVIGTGWGRNVLNQDNGRWYFTIGNVF